MSGKFQNISFQTEIGWYKTDNHKINKKSDNWGMVSLIKSLDLWLRNGTAEWIQTHVFDKSKIGKIMNGTNVYEINIFAPKNIPVQIWYNTYFSHNSWQFTSITILSNERDFCSWATSNNRINNFLINLTVWLNVMF